MGRGGEAASQEPDGAETTRWRRHKQVPTARRVKAARLLGNVCNSFCRSRRKGLRRKESLILGSKEGGVRTTIASAFGTWVVAPVSAQSVTVERVSSRKGRSAWTTKRSK